MVEKVAAGVQGRDGAGRHHRPGRRALRADQDAAADHRHDPRRQEPRARRLDRGHARVDGPLQRHDRARHRGRARRDRDADRRGADHARPVAVLRRSPPARRASSWTRRRSSCVGNARGRRRPLPHRPLGDEGRARRGRHLGRDPRRRPRAARAAAPSDLRRPAGQRLPQVRGRPATARSAAGATPCSTTPTSTGTARSRRASAA